MRGQGFTFFTDMLPMAEDLSNEHLGEVLRLVLRGFPECEFPQDPAARMFYKMLLSQHQRDNEYRQTKAETNQENGSKSIGRPRTGETPEQYQERKAEFNEVLNYCKECGYIEALTNNIPIPGLMDQLKNKFPDIKEDQILSSLNWIKNKYRK